MFNAQAVSMENWSPPCPSATHADSYPRSSASRTHSTTSGGDIPPPVNATPSLSMANLENPRYRQPRPVTAYSAF